MGLVVVTGVITCWGLWASPKAQQQIRVAPGRTDDDTIPITIAVKIIVFSGAVVLLALAGWWWWAALLTAMILLLMGLSLVRSGSDTGSADLHREAGEVVVIHDYATPGWEGRQVHADFNAWFRSAIDDLIEFEMI